MGVEPGHTGLESEERDGEGGAAVPRAGWLGEECGFLQKQGLERIDSQSLILEAAAGNPIRERSETSEIRESVKGQQGLLWGRGAT